MIAVVFSLLSAASLANGAVAGRAGMQGVHPIAVIGIALVVGFIGVAIAALALSPSDLFNVLNVPRSALLWIVVFGVVQFAVGRTSAYTDLSTIGASRVALFIATQVPFAAFFAIAFTGESLGILVAVGTVAVMLGLLLASGDSRTKGWRTDRRYLIGCLARADGRGGHRGQQGPGQAGRKRIRLTAGHHGAGYAGGNVHCVPVVTIIASRNPTVRAFDWRSMGFIFMSGLSTTVSIVAQLFAVQRADVLIVAPILATFPLWTLLLSHIFISRLEQITLRLTIGAIVTVAGVIAVVLGGQL